jgi:hypothetical protein
VPSLVVPGVRVEARFDVLPPLPAPSGILGAVGIVDRPSPDGAPVAVTKVTELRELLGPGTQASMPEVAHALSNGALEAVVAPVAGGGPATAPLLNVDSARAVLLRARSNGEWGNDLRADIRGIANADGEIVRVSLRLLREGTVVETFSDLQVAPGEPDDLFDTINRLSRFVVAVDPGFENVTPKEGTFAFDEDGTPIEIEEAGGTRKLLRLVPGEEASPDGLSVEIEVADDDTIAVRVFQGGLQEEHTDLVMTPDSADFLPYALLRRSRLIRVQPLSSLDAGKRLPAPTDTPTPFADGTSPTVDAYRDAIDRLVDDTRIDLVLASIEPKRSNDDVRAIHQALVAHAQVAADAGAPRIAFGSVTRDEQRDLGKIKDHAASVRNRRFVLVSPPGAEGAVAGLIGRMNPQDSPTFKPTPLHGLAPATYRESELNRLLGPTTNLVVVQDRPGRGVIVLKGIDTTGDQISVTRVADQAIRETKAISENYIGRLNSEEARIGLREQLVATFTRMERDGALVPSTDGQDPAFLVDVYSTQTDFAQGIVRIDIAVRPVRAIDYVYATIRVKN